MIVSLLRRLGRRRSRPTDDQSARPHGSGWDRLYDDPTYDFTRRMSESPGGQPPRVHRRGDTR